MRIRELSLRERDGYPNWWDGLSSSSGGKLEEDVCEGALGGGVGNDIHLGTPALCSETLFLPHPDPQGDFSRWRRKTGRRKEEVVTGERGEEVIHGEWGDGGRSARLETGRSPA